MIIRDAKPADHEPIVQLVTAAFGRPDEARLVERLTTDGDTVLSLVAVEKGMILGHVLLSRMTAPIRALGLGPVAITPARQRSGVGRQLIAEAIERATAQGWQAMFVLGEPAYYGRFGFDAAQAEGYASPYAGPYLMVLPLGGPLAATTGPIDYAPAFADVD